jgi:hypothetical protein
MKQLLHLCLFLVIPFSYGQETEISDVCSHPEQDAVFPAQYGHFSNWFMNNMNEFEQNNCFRPDAEFYFNITVEKDGTVSVFDLECVNAAKTSCIVGTVDLDKVPKWIPASENNQPCRQKIRERTWITFQN